MKHSVQRDLAIVMAARVLQMAVLLLALRAMTTRLSPAEVGNFSLLMSIASLFVWVFISPAGHYVNRHVHEWWENGSVWLNYGRGALYVVGIASCTAIVLELWGIIFKPAWMHQITWLGPLVGAYIIFSVANTTIIPAINLFGRRISYSILYAVSQILCLAFSWFLSGKNATGESWFLGQAIGFLAGALLALPIFLKTAPPRSQNSADIAARIRAVATFCLPIAITSGLTWLQFQSYRIVIGNLVSLDFLGLFFAGYTVSSGILGAVEITAGQFFGPYFYRQVQEADAGREHDSWAAYMSTLYPMIIVIVMAIAALSIPIAHLLLAQKFWAASAYVAAGALVEGVRVMGGTYALAAHVSKRTHALLLPHAVGAVSIVTALLGGTWLFGEAAVVPAMIAAALAFLLTMHLTMTRHAGTRFTILGWPWLICMGGFLGALKFLHPLVAGYGKTADYGFAVAGSLAILGAFLLVLRAALPTLARFSR